MINFGSVFFGKIANREIALDMAKWAGLSFYGVAALFAFLSLLAIFYLYLVAFIVYIFIAVIYVAFGYLIASKLSRAAAIMGTLIIIPCLVLSFLLPGNNWIPCLLALWFGVRGIEATFKLTGRFYAVPPSGNSR